MNAALAVFEAFASQGAGALLAGVAYALPIALVAWAVIMLLPRANAATRYGIWLAALAATLALDPLPGHPWVAASPAAASGRVSSVQRTALDSSAAPATANRGAQTNDATAGAVIATSSEAARPARAPLVTLPGDWAVALFLAWYLVATALVVRLMVGHFRLQRIKDRAAYMSPWHQSRLAAWLRVSTWSRVPRLLVSEAVDTPVAIGLFHPAIVLPAGLVEHLTDNEFDQIGLHELAHVQRFDDWTNLLQKIAEALLFFSPAVFVIGRQLSVEREVACDDWVVAATGSPRPYASCLTRLAELAASRPVTALPSLGAVFTQKQIFTRIERLLDRTRNARPHVAKGAAWAAAAGLLAVLTIATQMTPLVAVSATSAPHSVAAMHSPSIAHHVRPVTTVAYADVSNIRPRSSSAPCPRKTTLRRAAARAALVVARVPARHAHARLHQVAAATLTDAIPAVSPDAIKTALEALASAPSEEERLAAIGALVPATGETRVRVALLHALSTMRDEAVRLNIVAALAPYADRAEVLSAFGKVLRADDDEPVALNIIAALAPAAGNLSAIESLATVLNSSKDEAVALNALAAVAPFADRPAVQTAMITLMRTGRSEALRLNAVAALAPLAHVSIVHGALVNALDSDLPGAERANIKAALGIAPPATEVASALAFSVAHSEAAAVAHRSMTPGSEVMLGDVAPGGTVRIDNVHGNIEVIGWDRASGEVDASVDGDENAVRVFGTFEHGDLHVTSTPIANNTDVSVNYVIHVPAGAHVIVTTVTGNIVVRGVTGAVDATSTEGNVDVNGAHGRVSASSVSGDVQVTGLRGDSRLRTVSGDVRAEFDELDGAQDVDAESAKGDITIVMPAGSSAHITAQTVSGTIDAPNGEGAGGDSPGARVDTKTGGGSAIVNVRAVSGDITITSP